MKLGWGAGVVIAILLSVAAYLFGLVDLTHMVSLALLVVGLWTIGGALFVVERKDRNYYGGWGVVLAVLSSFAYLPPNYAIGLLLVAIVALILLYAYVGRTGKMLTAATSRPPAGGGTPAANYATSS